MPVIPSYPGVYIEEIPSGVRSVVGVATSITTFVGRALRGPVGEPVTINSFGDYERVFGGLWAESALGFAVRDFFLNSGGQAVIVRLFHPFFSNETERNKALQTAQAVASAAVTAAAAQGATAANVAKAAGDEAKKPAHANDPVKKQAAAAVAAAAQAAAGSAAATPDTVKQAAVEAVPRAAPLTRARLIVDTLTLEAASEGTWGNSLRVRVDYATRAPFPNEVADTLFNLIVKDTRTGNSEQFRNVSVADGHSRQVDKVLANESQLVRVVGSLPIIRPQQSADPPPSSDPWDDNQPPTCAKVKEDGLAVDGCWLEADDFVGTGKAGAKQGLYALEKIDLFNLLCIPPYLQTGDVDTAVVTAAARYCERRRAMLIVDPPTSWSDKDKAKSGVIGVGTASPNATLVFPRLRQPNPLRDNQIEDFAPCGAVAGVIARTDAQRGVWKAPAGLEATLVGVTQLSVPLTDAENGELNPLGLNCLRTLPGVGPVVWGARTLQGADRLASEWKYIPVRRLALYIEESLYRGTQWVVFEPNDEPLWAQIRLNVGAFMHNLFRQGAFQGRTPREAYFVKCDRESTTQNDINQGIVNVVVGFAPLKPAEFVIIKIQQMAGQVAV